MSEELERALRHLPHGPEFRFLDRLVSLEPGTSGAGEYAVRGDEPFLRGHFPGHPIFPGVLLVEAAAQLAGVVVQGNKEASMPLAMKLAAVRGIKIVGTAKPGDVIRLEAKVLGRLGNLFQAQVTASVNGEPVMQGELTLSGS